MQVFIRNRVRNGRELPSWLLAAAGVLAVAVLCLFVLRICTATEQDAGPRMKVYPGMYDLRAEAAKHNDGQNVLTQSHGTQSGGK